MPPIVAGKSNSGESPFYVIRTLYVTASAIPIRIGAISFVDQEGRHYQFRLLWHQDAATVNFACTQVVEDLLRII